MGRPTVRSPLGGMAAHLYAEFDGGELDAARLRQAVEMLYLHHPLLRLRITDDGQQTIAPPVPGIPCISTTGDTPMETTLAAALAAKRQAKSTQLLPLEQGVPCDISLSLLPEGRSRLHVDLDMIAGDAMSFRLLMEDLAAFYHQCPAAPSHDAPPAYFDHLERRNADEALRQRRERSQRWWRARLAQVPPAPRLLRTPDRCRSDRLAIQLNAEESRALESVAKRHHTSSRRCFWRCSRWPSARVGT